MDRSITMASQARFRLEFAATAFPFRCELSLAPLVAAWEAMAAEPGIAGDLARTVCQALERPPELAAPGGAGALARPVCRGLERGPRLRAAIEDPAVLERHRDLVEVLMSLVFP